MGGQGCLSSDPLGCASFPPYQLLNTHPPWFTILILIKSQGQMGTGREKRDHSESTLKWQQSLGVTAVSPEAWPVPHVRPGSG